MTSTRGAASQSGDVLEQMKVSQNTLWRKINRHWLYEAQEQPGACNLATFLSRTKRFFQIPLLAKNEYEFRL
jgi:hypothetical protein